MKELKSKHRAVARYLAVGLPLDKICDNLGLNYATWKTISNQELFKEAVRLIQVELEDRLIDESISDPVLLKIKLEAGKSVDRLVLERDMVETELGASSTTRISAAKSLLALSGYDKDQKAMSPMITINLTQDKIAAVMRNKDIKPQPDRIEPEEDSTNSD